MGSYNTTSGFPDLVGTCEIDDSGDCTSYNSNTLGNGNVNNQGGPFLSFTVQWPNAKPPRTYAINAGPDSNGWSGEANNGVGQVDESWAATATSAVAASGKSY